MFKRVSSGDELQILSAEWNSVGDMYRAFVSRGKVGPGTDAGPNENIIVTVRNKTDVQQNLLSVLCIDGIIIDPNANMAKFRQRPMFDVVVPTNELLQKFVILLQPLAPNAIGDAVLIGMTAVQISVSDESHQYASPQADETKYLVSSSYGLVRILYKESGTGIKWGAVQFPIGGGASRWCKITSVEGDAPPFLYSAIEITPDANGTFEDGSTVFNRNLYNVAEQNHPGCGKVPVDTPVMYYEGSGCYLFDSLYYRGTYG